MYTWVTCGSLWTCLWVPVSIEDASCTGLIIFIEMGCERCEHWEYSGVAWNPRSKKCIFCSAKGVLEELHGNFTITCNGVIKAATFRNFASTEPASAALCSRDPALQSYCESSALSTFANHLQFFEETCCHYWLFGTSWFSYQYLCLWKLFNKPSLKWHEMSLQVLRKYETRFMHFCCMSSAFSWLVFSVPRGNALVNRHTVLSCYSPFLSLWS